METPVQPEVVMPQMETPVQPEVVMPQMEAQVQPEMAMPQMETPIQPAQKEPVIYGGASPIVNNIDFHQESHQIYGGANPLENTQSIPISNIAGPNATQVQTPTETPTMITPQIDTINNQQ